ncbi:MAG: hypothetical protein F6K23_35840 [Okeania sp. SIO2C9]|uniref:hypothetical protein n=1 Tax=Okeania sp. SIO2C9 TaxID=2607791 RepID=UPI0013BEDDE3|nr:hypothetical protein [Okeania sp. SIO2C9]NEQ77914.1 hypothetical protein [Okeania sp. SIO2C9]
MYFESRHLLIISCTRRKSLDVGLIPAIARYDGPKFRVLRRFLQQQPSNCQDIYIFVYQVWANFLSGINSLL